MKLIYLEFSLLPDNILMMAYNTLFINRECAGVVVMGLLDLTNDVWPECYSCQ